MVGIDALSVVSQLRIVALNTNPMTKELQTKIPRITIGLCFFLEHPDSGIRLHAAQTIAAAVRRHKLIITDGLDGLDTEQKTAAIRILRVHAQGKGRSDEDVEVRRLCGITLEELGWPLLPVLREDEETQGATPRESEMSFERRLDNDARRPTETRHKGEEGSSSTRSKHSTKSNGVRSSPRAPKSEGKSPKVDKGEGGTSSESREEVKVKKSSEYREEKEKGGKDANHRRRRREKVDDVHNEQLPTVSKSLSPTSGQTFNDVSRRIRSSDAKRAAVRGGDSCTIVVTIPDSRMTPNVPKPPSSVGASLGLPEGPYEDAKKKVRDEVIEVVGVVSVAVQTIETKKANEVNSVDIQQPKPRFVAVVSVRYSSDDETARRDLLRRVRKAVGHGAKVVHVAGTVPASQSSRSSPPTQQPLSPTPSMRHNTDNSLIMASLERQSSRGPKRADKRRSDKIKSPGSEEAEGSSKLKKRVKPKYKEQGKDTRSLHAPHSAESGGATTTPSTRGDVQTSVSFDALEGDCTIDVDSVEAPPEYLDDDESRSSSGMGGGFNFFSTHSVLFGQSRYFGHELVPTADDPEVVMRLQKLKQQKQEEQQSAHMAKSQTTKLDKLIDNISGFKFW